MVYQLLPGLESYISGEHRGYAAVAVGSYYPHACSSFDHPVRYAASLRAKPARSLLFVVVRGRSRVEDVSWRVSVNEVKVSRVFKPQHVLRAPDASYYVYVADVSPALRDTANVELVLRCHAYDTHVEAAGFVSLLPGDFQSRVAAYLGVSRVDGGLTLRVAEGGFSLVSVIGRGRGGSMEINGTTRELNGLFEVSELARDNTVHVRGPADVYAIVTTTLPGRPAELVVSGVRSGPGKLRLELANPGDYPVDNVVVRLLRGAQVASAATLSRIGPRGAVEVDLDLPVTDATVKVTYEFCGHEFSRLVRVGLNHSRA